MRNPTHQAVGAATTLAACAGLDCGQTDLVELMRVAWPTVDDAPVVGARPRAGAVAA